MRGNVRVATRGAVVRRDTAGMLATSRLRDVMAEMSGQADYVLCDSGPLLLVHDNLLLAGAVDGVILVVKAGTTPCADLARVKTTLESVGARIIGVVINQMPPYQMKRYYKSLPPRLLRKERSRVRRVRRSGESRHGRSERIVRAMRFAC